MAEGRVAEVMRERDGFRQVLVQLQRPRDVACDGGDFHGMRQARAEVVAGAIQEDLGLVFQTTEGARVDDAVAVALVLRAPFRRRLGVFSPA